MSGEPTGQDFISIAFHVLSSRQVPPLMSRARGNGCQVIISLLYGMEMISCQRTRSPVPGNPSDVLAAMSFLGIIRAAKTKRRMDSCLSSSSTKKRRRRKTKGPAAA